MEKDYKANLISVKNILEIMLIEGDKKGKEISVAYECGMYIGTIKGIITHISELCES